MDFSTHFINRFTTLLGFDMGDFHQNLSRSSDLEAHCSTTETTLHKYTLNYPRIP